MVPYGPLGALCVTFGSPVGSLGGPGSNFSLIWGVILEGWWHLESHSGVIFEVLEAPWGALGDLWVTSG